MKLKENNLLIINNLIKEKDFFHALNKIILKLNEIKENIISLSINVETSYYDSDEDPYSELKNIEVKIKTNNEDDFKNLKLSHYEEFVRDILFNNYDGPTPFLYNFDCYIERKGLNDEDYINKIIFDLINNDKITQRIKNNNGNIYSEDISKGALFSENIENMYLDEMNVYLKNKFCDFFYTIMHEYKNSDLDFISFSEYSIKIKMPDQRNEFDMIYFSDEKSLKMIKDYHSDKYETILCFVEYNKIFKELNELSDFDFVKKMYTKSGFSFILDNKELPSMIETINNNCKEKDCFKHYFLTKEKEYIENGINIENFSNKNKKRL